MNCAQQYVSKILKGRENMPLDTLSKLEDALGINLIYDEQTTYPTWWLRKNSYNRSKLIAHNVEELFSCTSGLTTASPDSCSNLNVSSIKFSNELSLGNPIFWRKR